MTIEETVAQSSDLVLVNSDKGNITQQRLEELGRILLEFRLTSEQDSEKIGKTLKRLQRQAFWLRTGLLLTLLGLGGSLAGVTFLLRADQVQLAREVNEISQQGGSEANLVSRLDSLASQVQGLEAGIPQGLSLTLETTQTQLETLSQTVAAVKQNLDQRQSVTAILTNALQALVENPPASAPSFNQTPAESDLAPLEQASDTQPEIQSETQPAEAQE